MATAQSGGLGAGPASGAQMHPGADCLGQADIPGDDQSKPAGAADAGHSDGEGSAVRGMVVTEDNAA